MKVYILGIDGYIGWALYKHLSTQGFEVGGCDNYFRRTTANSLVPLQRDHGVIDALDVQQFDALARHLSVAAPDCVVHLAEIPSAPFSMANGFDAMRTMSNNVTGTVSVIEAMKLACPKAHLLKLGSMGEYIPSSWYHMSKVVDTENCKYASETFGLSITDVMQGPVYGVGGRFDYDEIWGTVINRWVAMGLAGAPLLVYGSGAQVRGFLPIQDSLACLQLIMENPPEPGEYRMINQYAVKCQLIGLAKAIAEITGVEVACIENPRTEKMDYEQDSGCDWLLEHGYKPTLDIIKTVEALVESVRPYKDTINVGLFPPKVRWNNGC